MCYVFLGTIQELIIQHLDAAILRGPVAAAEPDFGNGGDDDADDNEDDNARG
jgi:hypothetical protein